MNNEKLPRFSHVDDDIMDTLMDIAMAQVSTKHRLTLRNYFNNLNVHLMERSRDYDKFTLVDDGNFTILSDSFLASVPVVTQLQKKLGARLEIVDKLDQHIMSLHVPLNEIDHRIDFHTRRTYNLQLNTNYCRALDVRLQQPFLERVINRANEIIYSESSFSFACEELQEILPEKVRKPRLLTKLNMHRYPNAHNYLRHKLDRALTQYTQKDLTKSDNL